MPLKITCILTSFNRPTLVRQALKSVADQGYKNYELLVVDDSTLFDVRRLVGRYHFPAVKVTHFDVTPAERSQKNRLGMNVNAGLRQATGDLVCYLADDDYYYQDWFEQAAQFFEVRPYEVAGYGSLTYSNSMSMDFSQSGSIRFPGDVVTNPAGRLDHTQVMHRLRKPPVLWPETLDSVKESDAIFFTTLSHYGSFLPIHCNASVKRLHSKNLQNHISDLEHGKLENLRD